MAGARTGSVQSLVYRRVGRLLFRPSRHQRTAPAHGAEEDDGVKQVLAANGRSLEAT